MKQSIAYEFRRILMPLIIFTVIAAAFFVVTALSTDFVTNTLYPGTSEIYHIPRNTLAYVPAAILLILCYLVPAMQFAFMMKRRSADLWYSLPIRREKLMLTRLVSGMMLVFVPYTVSFFAGVGVIACSLNAFKMEYYFAMFASSLPLGAMLFGINSFLFTRANTVFDGTVFMIAGMFAVLAPASYIFTCLNIAEITVDYGARNSLNYMPFGPLVRVFSMFDTAILGRDFEMTYAWIPLTIAAVEGVAAYFGLFFTARTHRAEDAEQVSSSPFGYRTLIPYYLLFTAAICVPSVNIPAGSDALIYYLAILVLGAVAYFIYRRSFRLSKRDCFWLFGSFFAGIAVMILLWVIYCSLCSYDPAVGDILFALTRHEISRCL